jgi:predicted anti-sigma-YlaC factor YlaD
MDCREFEILAPDLISNELEVGERKRVQSHHDGCPSCQSFLADLQEITVMLRDARNPGAPEDLWDRIQARIDERTLSAMRTVRVWFAACAAVLLVLVSVFAIKTADESNKRHKINFARINFTTAEADEPLDPISHMLLSSSEFDE